MWISDLAEALPTVDARDLQRLLSMVGAYRGLIDGDIGPQTSEGITKLLLDVGAAALANNPQSRKIVAAAQAALTLLGYQPGPIDGYFGHNTREALTEWATKTFGKRPPKRPKVPAPAAKPVAKGWPRESALEAFYGPAGGYEASAGMATLPFAFPLAWNPSQQVIRFACHSKCAAAFTQVFADAAKHYGEVEYRRLRLDLFGGCYMNRRKRGGAQMSVHAYGAAVDLDPERNQLRWGRDRASFAGQEYEPFWRIVEAAGLTSLGRRANFDWMHFQAATP